MAWRALIDEIRYAWRRLWNTPLFTLAATLILAIAIGGTASVFGLVDGVLLKPFPFRAPDRVLAIWETNPTLRAPRFGFSPPDYLDYAHQATSFAAIEASESDQATITGTGEPERVNVQDVTPSFFSVLGITPVIGRPLSADSAGPPEAAIGYGYWQRRFGGSKAALGQTLIVDGRPYTVVAVMPPGLPGTVDLWKRLSFGAADLAHRDWHYVGAVGRLKPGVTREAADQELRTIARRLAVAYPATDMNWSATTVPILEALLGPVRPGLLLLLAGAICVLLIGAANLANLFLVRGLAREREMAVRTALGATRSALVRQLVAEAAMLGGAAAVLGAGLAVVGVAVLRTLAPPTLPRLQDVSVNADVVGFCALVAVAAVIVFGLLPAWRSAPRHLALSLTQGGRSAGSGQHRRIQDTLVVVQVAIALVLLTEAGLLMKSFAGFEQTDLGFQPRDVLTAQVAPSAGRDTLADRQDELARQIADGLSATPGVVAASVSSGLPGGVTIRWGFDILGEAAPDASHRPTVRPVAVTPGYFGTMGIRLLHGRLLVTTDDPRSPPVATIDELVAREYFPGRDPVGLRVAMWGPNPDTVQIVGVVDHVRQGGLVAEDIPVLYLPMAQNRVPGMLSYVALRTSGNPARLASTVKRTVAQIDPTLPIYDVKTLDGRVAESVGTIRFSGLLASAFAIIATVLGLVGIYSVLMYIVTQRQREVAVRIALGATPARVMGEVLRRTLALTAAGVAVGSGVAWVGGRMLASAFVGVRAHDPAVFIAAAIAFALTAVAAASIPAVRTSRVSPLVALTSV